ncbi:MAG TPA: DoxX family protein [Gemmatimonadaceae bacterium]|nr:DoxX family protein [Gemmatimonadaceae bacterium]
MSLFSSPSRRQLDIGLTILRLVVGLIFVAHGGQKLFVFGLDGVAGSFGQMGIPAADVMGPFVAFVEFFGGLALIFGLLTRLAAVGLAGVMTVAIMTVHIGAGFFNPGGIEFPLSLLGASLALVVMGPGAYSLDNLIARRRVVAEETPAPAHVRRAA